MFRVLGPTNQHLLWQLLLERGIYMINFICWYLSYNNSVVHSTKFVQKDWIGKWQLTMKQIFQYILCKTLTYLCQVSWFIIRNGVGFTMDEHNPVVVLDLVGGVNLGFCYWIYWRSIIHNHFIRRRRLHLSKFWDRWKMSYIKVARFYLYKP